MKERPILFSGAMVKAILAGTKTQTRRVVKLPADAQHVKYWTTPSGGPQVGYADPGINYWTESGNHIDPCPYGVPGDRLWVRESWSTRLDRDHLKPRGLDPTHDRPMFWADPQTCNTGCGGAAGRKRASFHLPRWASRLTLEVVNVRVERLQEINEPDAIAEGVQFVKEHSPDHRRYAAPAGQETWSTAHDAFAWVWHRLNAKRGYGWDKNPWVWCLTFKRVS